MKFTKMHGLGNDYIFLHCPQGEPEGAEALARQLSHRHTGVGGDGLICICPSETADFRMAMFNADGSRGTMCGNGIRCLGKYVYDRKLTAKTRLTVETGGGIRILDLQVEGGTVAEVTVDMGVPQVGKPMVLDVEDVQVEGIPVWMGNTVPAGKCGVCSPPGQGPHCHAGVGAGQRGDHGLRHRGQRRTGRFCLLWRDGTEGGGVPAWRRTVHLLGGGRACAYDRTRRDGV